MDISFETKMKLFKKNIEEIRNDMEGFQTKNLFKDMQRIRNKSIGDLDGFNKLNNNINNNNHNNNNDDITSPKSLACITNNTKNFNNDANINNMNNMNNLYDNDRVMSHRINYIKNTYDKLTNNTYSIPTTTQEYSTPKNRSSGKIARSTANNIINNEINNKINSDNHNYKHNYKLEYDSKLNAENINNNLDILPHYSTTRNSRSNNIAYGKIKADLKKTEFSQTHVNANTKTNTNTQLHSINKSVNVNRINKKDKSKKRHDRINDLYKKTHIKELYQVIKDLRIKNIEQRDKIRDLEVSCIQSTTLKSFSLSNSTPNFYKSVERTTTGNDRNLKSKTYKISTNENSNDPNNLTNLIVLTKKALGNLKDNSEILPKIESFNKLIKSFKIKDQLITNLSKLYSDILGKKIKVDQNSSEFIKLIWSWIKSLLQINKKQTDKSSKAAYYVNEIGMSINKEYNNKILKEGIYRE